MATVIDTHCHASPYWFEPVEILLDEMERAGVDQAVLTQFFGVFDNSYLIEAVKRFPGRFAVIAIVDHTQPDAVDRVAELKDQGVDGLRFQCSWRSPGDDPLAAMAQVCRTGRRRQRDGSRGTLRRPGVRGDNPRVPQSVHRDRAPGRRRRVLGSWPRRHRNPHGHLPQGRWSWRSIPTCT